MKIEVEQVSSVELKEMVAYAGRDGVDPFFTRDIIVTDKDSNEVTLSLYADAKCKLQLEV